MKTSACSSSSFLADPSSRSTCHCVEEDYAIALWNEKQVILHKVLQELVLMDGILSVFL